MIKKLLRITLPIMIVVSVALTGLALAGSGDAVPCSSNCGPNFQLNFKLENPLKVGSIQDAIKLFMNALVKIAIPFIIVMFIWSGLKFILARGDPKALGAAKNMFLGTVLGTLVILGAWTITNAIVGTINSIGSSTNG